MLEYTLVGTTFTTNVYANSLQEAICKMEARDPNWVYQYCRCVTRPGFTYIIDCNNRPYEE